MKSISVLKMPDGIQVSSLIAVLASAIYARASIDTLDTKTMRPD